MRSEFGLSLSPGQCQQQLMEVNVHHWTLKGPRDLPDPNPQQAQT